MAQVVAIVEDLLFASKIEATLAAAGHRVTIASTLDAAPIADADVLIADLAQVDPRALAGGDVPVLGFYSHVDTATRDRAEAAGLDLVVPRSRMAREMPELVACLVSE